MIVLLDGLIGLCALASSAVWWLASRQRLRRISRLEELDAADMNRLVTVLNRTQILNARAALLASVTAALAALRIGIQAVRDV
ncbi:MAG: hypothetical protein C0447_15765 [Methylobacterium sp.]|uniref:hypothetical protein n=1 Tax=Bosea sp. (in: a-proteobacteria) TaxID=1871050 RepID=UPI000BD45860|nr:hypothetical protein [Bosea sp. (in: a-proteobacteria)]MBA4270847.1 hypothetical protein [Methylobacterium sp.]MCZ8041079.1 hypothetical protein [Beijerinckiaceae bacterium]OYW68605.1 MAG: hypothetical protein B7Z40_02095 [Bosea sp. 12-68-7]